MLVGAMSRTGAPATSSWRTPPGCSSLQSRNSATVIRWWLRAAAVGIDRLSAASIARANNSSKRCGCVTAQDAHQSLRACFGSNYTDWRYAKVEAELMSGGARILSPWDQALLERHLKFYSALASG